MANTNKLYNFYGDPRKFTKNIHPVHIEFVAVPPHFDIKIHLSIREVIGQFMNHDITLKSVELIAESIRESPTFTLSSPTGTYAASAIMVIEIIKQIGLQVRNISNFMPTDAKSSYESILANRNFTNEEGKPVMDMTFVFINLYKFAKEATLNQVLKSIASEEEYYKEFIQTEEIYTK